MNKDQIIFETESELCMESRDSITIDDQKKSVKPQPFVWFESINIRVVFSNIKY